MKAVNGGSECKRSFLLFSKSFDFDSKLLRQLAILTDNIK